MQATKKKVKLVAFSGAMHSHLVSGMSPNVEHAVVVEEPILTLHSH
jgi:hypothetical protein